jgi:hypothetical protein
MELFIILLVAALTLGVEALTAVDGPVSTGLERHLGGAAAAIADYFVHLTLATTGSATLGIAPVGAAGMAPAGLVLKALLGKESLFGSRVYEFGAAVAAGQGLVLIHDGFPPKFIIYPNLCALQSFPWIPSNGFGLRTRRNDPDAYLAGLTQNIISRDKQFVHPWQTFFCPASFRRRDDCRIILGI